MERKNRVRLRIFNGSKAMEERKQFQEFIKENTPSALDEAKDKLWNLVFSAGGSERVSRILQSIFIWYYENYLRDNRPLKIQFVEKLRIRTGDYDYEKALDALYENLKWELYRFR